MIKKLFNQMLLTQVLSTMTVTLCMLIDSIMIGRFLGVDSMSAYGFSTPLLLVFAALGAMISAGIQVVCGKTVGRGDREGTDSCFSVSVFLIVVIAVVGMALILIFLRPLTTLLGAGKPGADNPVFDLTKDYIIGFILGAPAFLAAQIMVPYLQLGGCRTRLVVAVLAMTITDVVLDLLNVLVFHGGTLGMGLASSISYYVAFFIGIGYFLRKDCLFHFRRGLLQKEMGLQMLGSGMPSIINQVSTVLLVFLLNHILMGLAGSTGVAAYSVLTTVSNICFCVGAGIGAVALTLSALFYADQDRTSLHEVIRVMTRNCLLLCLPLTVLVLVAARPLVTLFLGSNVDAKELAVSGVRLFSLTLLVSTLNTSLKNYYLGTGRVRLSELISGLQNFCMPALFALLLSRLFGINGVWLCFVFGETVTLLLISLMVWRRKKRVTISTEAYSLLDDDFGAAPDKIFERVVETEADCVDISRAVCDFCEARGLDDRTSTLVGLCIEEMTLNIVTHGFTKDNRAHNVDVRLVLGDDANVIRIRDNCRHFDPTNYLELHQTLDPIAHIGIRMVMAMVREATYVNPLGLNNLTLVL